MTSSASSRGDGNFLPLSAAVAGHTVSVDPLRFRANIMFDGLQAWEEWLWPGRRIRMGGATLLVTEPTVRCPATQVGR